MSVNMYHHEAILEAICWLCQGAVRLRADAVRTRTLQVGSNRLLRPGSAVQVVDDVSGPEDALVSEVNGLTEVVLEEELSGEYLEARNARVKLVASEAPEPAWVGRGRPELAPQPLLVNFPCVVVEPRRLEQPLRSGTNRAYTQEYWTSVYYVRRRSADEEEEMRLLGEVKALFNLLMGDPYLGGTCWYSQVSEVAYGPDVERTLRESGAPVRVVRLDVVARRSELGPAA